jgi:IMP dehydrogenase
LNARELMTEDVVTLAPDDDIRKAIRKFEDNHITGAPVVDEKNRVLGIVSESDILEKDESVPVRDVMTSTVETVEEDIEVEELAVIFRARKVNRLPVVRDGKLVGIVTRDNLITYLANILAWKRNQ